MAEDSYDDGTAADDAVPDDAVPDDAVPDDAVPDDAVPDDAAPDDAVPATAVPAKPSHPGLLAGRHASSAVIGVLTLLLGFAIAVQVHANSSTDALSGLREDDLVSILDNQDNRADRLRLQINELQNSLRRLQSSGNRSAAARAQARSEAQSLGVLLGTLPAYGPGVTITVTDPDSAMDGEDLLDVIEELRGAGAEAIQFGSVRVGTSTAFTGGKGSISVDGTKMSPPYRVIAIGDAKTLDTALNIPGGVAATVRTAGGDMTVVEHAKVIIRRTRTLPRTVYAKPSH